MSKRKIKMYTLEDLKPYFHMKPNKAATHLGISIWTIRNIYKANNIDHWPEGKLTKIDKSIELINKELSINSGNTKLEDMLRQCDQARYELKNTGKTEIPIYEIYSYLKNTLKMRYPNNQLYKMNITYINHNFLYLTNEYVSRI